MQIFCWPVYSGTVSATDMVDNLF